MNPGRPGGQDAMTITEPSLAWRDPRPYVFVPRTVTMATIASAADELPGLFGGLAGHGLSPAGPPFLRYNVIDMEHELQLEAGVPVAAPATGEGPAEEPDPAKWETELAFRLAD